MKATGRLAIGLLLFLLFASPALGQYMFLDTNGDGINDPSDRLDPNGITMIDIWLDSGANRDGSPATCDTDAATPLTVSSWEVVLRAVGGTLEWGPLENVLPISPERACFADASDTTDPVWYHNGWGGYYILEAGRFHLARLRVRVLSGDPSIVFRPFDPAEPTDITSFGTRCSAIDGDNTYKLGLDWFDVSGLGEKLVADAGGPYLSKPSIPIPFDGQATLNPAGRPLTYTWDFGDGATATGATPTHAYAEVGEYTVALSVTDGLSSDVTWTTARVIPESEPTARAGGPYTGYREIPVFFDGRGSSDPNGDGLRFAWTFGDGVGSNYAYAYHTYYAAGVFDVRLTVSDGVYSATDATTARIDNEPQRPPVADAGGPYTGYAGVRLQLDGSGSSDPDDDPLTFRWIFGDGGESSMHSPRHAYERVGEYEVILEVNDGTFTTSHVTSATIGEPVGSPPTAHAGGPYESVPGQIIQFDGRGSSDADGDPLVFDWDFGDRTAGAGPVPTHSYQARGIFTVVLSVSDGVYVVDAQSTANVGGAGGQGSARAFLRGGARPIALGAIPTNLLVQIEPVDASFRVDDVDRSRVLLMCEGSGVSEGIRAVMPATLGTDADGNGVEEVTAAFRPEDVKRLLGHIERSSTATLRIEGSTWQGIAFSSNLVTRVIPAGNHLAAVVRPNPFNPQAIVTFTTSKPGRVSAHLFSMAGRLVKTLLSDAPLDPGGHDLILDARGDRGGMLSSGVYFLRIVGPDGLITKRVAIAK